MNGTVAQHQQMPPLVTQSGYRGTIVIASQNGHGGMVMQEYQSPVNASPGVAENSTRVIEAFVATHPIQKQHSVEHIYGRTCGNGKCSARESLFSS